MITAVSSEFFDSRDTPARGIGFPSCNNELARLSPNVADPYGYYHELGVPPDASEKRIRSAVRALLYRLHPDTGTGDVERLQRVKNIAEVLLDPVARDCYNRTPPGKRLMDKVYEAELSKLDGLAGLDEEQVRKVLQPQKATPYRIRPGRYDYLAFDHHHSDTTTANLWYHHLVAVAPMVGYRRVIKVMLHNGPRPDFDDAAAIMMIPRRWTPGSALAFMLFSVVARYPRHAAPSGSHSLSA